MKLLVTNGLHESPPTPPSLYNGNKCECALAISNWISNLHGLQFNSAFTLEIHLIIRINMFSQCKYFLQNYLKRLWEGIFDRYADKRFGRTPKLLVNNKVALCSLPFVSYSKTCLYKQLTAFFLSVSKTPPEIKPNNDNTWLTADSTTISDLLRSV